MATSFVHNLYYSKLTLIGYIHAFTTIKGIKDTLLAIYL